MYQSMDNLRSGSTAGCITMNDEDKIDPAHFISCLAAVCRYCGSANAVNPTKPIRIYWPYLKWDKLKKNKAIQWWAWHRRRGNQSFKENNHGSWINALHDQLEQHGRRDSLLSSGILENVENDDANAVVLTLCAAIIVDNLFQPKYMAVAHKVGKAATGKPQQVLLKYHVHYK